MFLALSIDVGYIFPKSTPRGVGLIENAYPRDFTIKLVIWRDFEGVIHMGDNNESLPRSIGDLEKEMLKRGVWTMNL